MMANILEYVSGSKGEDKREKLQAGLLRELSGKVNSMWATLLWITLLHASMLTFDTGHILCLHSTIFILMIAYKLFVYCRFMDSQHSLVPHSLTYLVERTGTSGR
jgi:hypothetical protein